jgi:hypothetical protein
MPELIKIQPSKFDPLEEMPDLTPLMDTFIRDCINMEEKLIIRLLTDLLGREPVIEDFKECARIVLPHFEPNDYIIAYKNTNLGFVKHQYHGSSVTVTFTPDAGTY